MAHDYPAILEKDGRWWIASTPDLPGANGQGETIEEAKEDLKAAIELLLEMQREDGLRGMSEDAVLDVVHVA
ncbi:hypothetical protein AYO38_06450 [bacterium SCGC AG-212-C10]|nr:hypothetical protein AYO38_06450 [bacterium SCGC AG-212-C10]